MDLQRTMELLTTPEREAFNDLFMRSGETDRRAYFCKVMPVREMALLGVLIPVEFFLRDSFRTEVKQ